MANDAATCPTCRYGMGLTVDYVCPACGQFNARLYRREHVDRQRARTMSDGECEAEWRAARMIPLGSYRDPLRMRLAEHRL